MFWKALAMWGANSLNGGGGAPGRDLRSVPNIHWGSMLSNMGDPLNFMGGSGSNVGANMTNPAGFGAIHGDVPNNNPDPSAQPGYGQTPGGAGGGPPTMMQMGTGISPQQQMQLYAAYKNYMGNLGIPGQGPARPEFPPPPNRAPAPNNYAALQALSRGDFRSPGRGPGGITYLPP